MSKPATARRGRDALRRAVVWHKTMVHPKTIAEQAGMGTREGWPEQEDLVANVRRIRISLPKRAFSKREAFLSGAALVFGVSRPSPQFDVQVVKERANPWHVVGDCVLRSLRRTVASDPLLPPLPDDLYRFHESPDQREMIERSSI